MQTNRNSPEVLAQILSPEFQARFWKWVNRKGPDECWPWIGNLNKWGYGEIFIMKFNGKHINGKSHRVAWIMNHKQFPPDEKPLILHSCIAHPECCNPAHLRPGTDMENTIDKINQGRGNYPWGERINTNKLSENQVIEIRRLLATGNYTHRQIAPMFGVGRTAISKIHAGDNWKHLIST